MILLVKAVAIVIIVWGCVLILRPSMLRKVLAHIREGNRFYTAGILKGLFGVILLLTAASCRIPWIVFFLGGLTFLSVILTFIVRKSIVEKLMNWVESRSKKQVSMIGTVVLAIGALLALAA
ncbi:MAG: hypothetical protein KAI70_05740 [Candidatus Omnitrophica bacterium]|nr:hypothetical protein [Candidatus Omnitrophota bacterium]